MRFHRFSGGDKDVLVFEELTYRFIIHKSLISDSTRDMIWRYLVSLEEPSGIRIYLISDTFIFETAECSFSDVPDEYIPFVL